MRKFLAVVTVGALVAAGVWWSAGRAAGPAIEIRQPSGVVGQSGPIEVSIDAPNGTLTSVDIAIEQNGTRMSIVELERPGGDAVRRESADRVVISRHVGKREQPDLKTGAARIVVHASRPVLYGLRHVRSEVTKDVQVRLEPPRVQVLSTFHYINQGGAEMVVYRATPADVTSGVRVGAEIYPGFPAAGVGLTADPSMFVAFFAVLHDQAADAPVAVFAQDAVGNQATAAIEHRVFPKPFKRSFIEVSDEFLQKVVPAIAATAPDMKISTAPSDLLASFLRINGDLRRTNSATLVELSGKTSKQMLWTEAFQPLANAKVEAGFADARTYVYKDKNVDHQTHLGFDLAVTQHVPVSAANRGVVVHAGDLGIYGNTVVVDHGLGVQSLYAHLSSVDVKVGASVDRGQVLGRSGMTGLAAGDHLHFTMLVAGRQVNPVEWWDPKWMQDRVFRKIQEAK